MTEQTNQQQTQSQPQSAQPAKNPGHENLQASGNLIDFDSRPSSKAPGEARPNPPISKPLQPTSQNATSLMDNDDHLSNPMSKMNMHETMVPQGQKLKRADTETSEIDEFVDAQG